MKIGIIGGGASGVFAAIRIKELHPDYPDRGFDFFLIDKKVSKQLVDMQEKNSSQNAVESRKLKQIGLPCIPGFKNAASRNTTG